MVHYLYFYNIIMKTLLTFFILIITYGLYGQVHVQFLTTSTSSDCQGSRQTVDGENDVSTPKPTNTTLFIYSLKKADTSNLNVIHSGDTLLLKPGKYLITFSEKVSFIQLEYLCNREKYPDTELQGSFYLNKHIITVSRKKHQVFTLNNHKYNQPVVQPGNNKVPGAIH